MAPGPGGWLARATGRLALLARAAGDRLFSPDDARAREYGWQVTARRAGLARSYRDPRFGRLRSCPACGGTGMTRGRQACGHCAGTGRSTVSPAPLAGRGRAG